MTDVMFQDISAPAVPTDQERAITAHVLGKLGRPSNLYRVDVKPVWRRRYRVNVYCSDEGAGTVPTVTMSDSYLVELADNGITSIPEIVRRYE